MSKSAGYVVVFESGVDGPLWLMGADPDCDGALIACGDPVMFDSHKDAERAIKISEKLAALSKAQELTVNTDFTNRRESVKIIPLHSYVKASSPKVRSKRKTS